MEATVERITRVIPIEGADRIELAVVQGYQSVVLKDKHFEAGELVVFVHPDTVCPSDNPAFSFLAGQGFRVKTARLRGVISQGIALKLSELDGKVFDDVTLSVKDGVITASKEGAAPADGEEVGQFLGIVHYTKPCDEDNSNRPEDAFPSGVPKTDETNLQGKLRVLEELKGKSVYISLKIDGQSFTATAKGGEKRVCSRNRSMSPTIEGSRFCKVYHKYNFDEILDRHPTVAVQGELAGPGVQGNRLALTDHELFVFDVWDHVENRYYGFKELTDFCEANGLKMVPIIQVGTLVNIDFDSLLSKASTLRYASCVPAEGMVLRPVDTMYSDVLRSRLSVKVINPLYKD
jgi:RNA ligase (TIGR02306 family)